MDSNADKWKAGFSVDLPSQVLRIFSDDQFACGTDSRTQKVAAVRGSIYATYDNVCVNLRDCGGTFAVKGEYVPGSPVRF